jgi:hypothetical protein
MKTQKWREEGRLARVLRAQVVIWRQGKNFSSVLFHFSLDLELKKPNNPEIPTG